MSTTSTSTTIPLSIACLSACLVAAGCDAAADDARECAHVEQEDATTVRLAAPASSPAVAERTDGIAFRGGPPWLQVIPAPMTLDDFVKVVEACPKVAALPLTISASGYDSQPDTSGTVPDEVLGLGFSTMVSVGLKECVQEAMEAKGAVFY